MIPNSAATRSQSASAARRLGGFQQALIAAAQKVEHYEIAGYGCVRTYAELLGHDEDAKLLQETLEEEKEADHKLNDLAKGTINVEAMEHETEEA